MCRMQMVDVSHIMVTTHLKFDLQQLTWFKGMYTFDFKNPIHKSIYV